MILVDTSVWIDYFNGVINTHTDKLGGYCRYYPFGNITARRPDKR